MFEISRANMYQIRDLNQKYFGNNLSEQKSFLIQNRIKRLFHKQDKYHNVTQMLDAIQKGEYLQEFINTFTTNKTSFFREVAHFDDLLERVFPEHFSQNNNVRIYSSAASTGEEAYSVAITFLEYQKRSQRLLNASVFATDIDTEVLEKAKTGIYKYDLKNTSFPKWVKPQEYFKRRLSESNEPDLLKVKKNISTLVTFKLHNLFNQKPPFGSTQFDIIFCRNVLIYFSQEDQEKVLKNLFMQLKVGGTLYTGHSESPIVLYPYVDKIGPSIYKKHSEIPQGA